jgi:hypothetical protein
MTQESRRALVKGLAVTLPAAWTAPVVESIILPAHAQTSPGGCGAPEGCFRFEDQSFSWPGGTGPEDVVLIDNDDCTGDPMPGGRMVLVESFEAAAQALGPCEGFLEVLATDPSPGGGCSFFICAPPVDP